MRLLSPEVLQALLSLPIQGGWIIPVEPYAPALSGMLDDDTILIEEDTMPEDGDGPWRVRLTEAGIEALLSYRE